MMQMKLFVNHVIILARNAPTTSTIAALIAIRQQHFVRLQVAAHVLAICITMMTVLIQFVRPAVILALPAAQIRSLVA
jgi:hypothetical protein